MNEYRKHRNWKRRVQEKLDRERGIETLEQQRARRGMERWRLRGAQASLRKTREYCRMQRKAGLPIDPSVASFTPLIIPFERRQ